MFDLTAEEARLLLNIALMAVGGNRFQSAAKAVALLSAQQFAAGVEFLDESALVRFPGNPMLLALKGMALLRLDRRVEAMEPLRLAAAQGEDPAAAQLAKGLMDND